MRAYQKLTALALLGTFAFGGSNLTGSIGVLNTLGTSLTGTTSMIDTANKEFIEPTFTITVNNNSKTGYSVTALSDYNSKLLHSTVTTEGSTVYDGHSIDYKLVCNDLESDGITYASGTGASGVTLTNNTSSPDILTSLVSSIGIATPNIQTTCTIDINADEYHHEQFHGSYSDNITISF